LVRVRRGEVHGIEGRRRAETFQHGVRIQAIGFSSGNRENCFHQFGWPAGAPYNIADFDVKRHASRVQGGRYRPAVSCPKNSVRQIHGLPGAGVFGFTKKERGDRPTSKSSFLVTHSNRTFSVQRQASVARKRRRTVGDQEQCSEKGGVKEAHDCGF